MQREPSGLICIILAHTWDNFSSLTTARLNYFVVVLYRRTTFPQVRACRYTSRALSRLGKCASRLAKFTSRLEPKVGGLTLPYFFHIMPNSCDWHLFDSILFQFDVFLGPSCHTRGQFWITLDPKSVQGKMYHLRANWYTLGVSRFDTFWLHFALFLLALVMNC